MFGLLISDVSFTWLPPSCCRIEPHVLMLAATGITWPPPPAAVVAPAGAEAVGEEAHPARPAARAAAARGTTRERRDDMQAPADRDSD
ncbi:hypothetical protein GCM10009610_54860 [Pseudonocardia xinjiangensis]